MRYTHLVLACGAAANLAEIPRLASLGYALKTVMDAIVMGNDETEPDAEERQRLLTMVVIGGGFSGVGGGGPHYGFDAGDPWILPRIEE